MVQQWPVARQGGAAKRATTPAKRSVSPRNAKQEKKKDEVAIRNLHYRVKRIIEGAGEQWTLSQDAFLLL